MSAKAAIIGKVSKLRGKVSVLLPHSVSAVSVSIGDSLKEDSSILTGKNSFILIKLIDKSTVSLGPNSKIILVRAPQKTAGVLSLLKGQVRSKIISNEKKNNRKNKFFVRTKSAAMGVRGTEFHAIYNPKADATTLLTYTGKVTLVKTKDSSKRVKPLIKKNDHEIIDQKINEMHKSLDAKEAVEVKNGQYSGTSEAMAKTSQAIKISPVQLTVLYKNEEMEEKIKKRDIAPPEDQAIEFEKDELLPQADQKPPIEGFLDKETGNFAQRAGGFVDPATGIYVEPEREAKIDDETKLYEGKKIGKIDLTTGQYKPPKGIELDPQKGFVVDRLAMAKIPKGRRKLFKDKARRLNRGLAFQVKKAKKVLIGELPKWAYTSEELWERDQLLFSYFPYSQSFKTSEQVNGDPETKFQTESAHYLEALWVQANGTKWRLVTGYAFKNLKYKDDSTLVEKNTNRYSKLSLGVLTEFIPHWTLSPRLELDQNPYLSVEGASGNTNERKLVRATIPKLRVHFKGRYHKWEKWTLDPLIAPSISFAKSFGKMRADMGVGLMVKMGASYWLKPNHSFEGGLWYSIEKGKVNGAGSDYKIKREGSGILLRYNWIL